MLTYKKNTNKKNIEKKKRDSEEGTNKNNMYLSQQNLLSNGYQQRQTCYLNPHLKCSEKHQVNNIKKIIYT